MAKRRGIKRRVHAPKPSRHSRATGKLMVEPIDYNRTLFTASFVTFLAMVFLLVAFNNSQITGNVITGHDTIVVQSPEGTVTTTTWNSVAPEASFLVYVFGEPVSVFGSSVVSSIIVTIAVWLLLFVTFGDIISSFSTFHRWVSWVIGFLLALIAANIGLVVKVVVWAVGIFSFVGAASVFVGLGSAFVAFILVNLGVISAGRWLINRKRLLSAAEMRSKAKAGGEQVRGTVEALRTIGKGLGSGIS